MFSIVGTIYKPTGNMLIDENGIEYPEMVPIEGFHVNSTIRIPEWAQNEVFPETPTQVFGGVKTYFYTFENENSFKTIALNTGYGKYSFKEGYEPQEGEEPTPENPNVEFVLIEPKIEEFEVPRSITMRQARLILLQTGLLDQIQTAIESLQSPQKEAVQIEWEYTSEVFRNNQWINDIAGALGLSDKDLDNLFIQASKL